MSSKKIIQTVLVLILPAFAGCSSSGGGATPPNQVNVVVPPNTNIIVPPSGTNVVPPDSRVVSP